MDKATMRAAHPDIAALVDEVRAAGVGISGLRIGDQTWGRMNDDPGWVEFEVTDAHVEMMRRGGHLLETKAVRVWMDKRRR